MNKVIMNETGQTIFVHRPLTFRFVIIPTVPLGGMRSIPAGVEVASPQFPVRIVTPREHPQEMSTVAGIKLMPLLPENSSTLAGECPPES